MGQKYSRSNLGSPTQSVHTSPRRDTGRRASVTTPPRQISPRESPRESPRSPSERHVSVNAAVLDQLWVVVCGGNRLFVKTPKARQLLRELAQVTGQTYSDEKAAKILRDILGGREVTEDDTFASADFFSMFFTLKTWAEVGDQTEVLLSSSLEARYQAFIVKKRAESLHQLPALLSPATGQPTAPKFPHLSFPVWQLKLGDQLDGESLRDGVTTTKAIWECQSNDVVIMTRHVLVRSHRLSYVRNDVHQLHQLVEQMRLLQCPQILAYLGSAKTDTSLDLVYYDPSSVNATCTLDTLLARRGRLDVTACKSIAGRVCKGLGWLHSRKTYVHLQVRADNVLVCAETMRAWLMGVGESFLRKRMDMVDVSLIDRTVGYASPELIKAEPLTCQADVWSVGTLLYRMLSGQNVFHGMEGTEILQAVLAGKRQSLDGIDPEMAAIVRRCWLEDPLERPTMPELVALLSSDASESDQADLLSGSSSARGHTTSGSPTQAGSGSLRGNKHSNAIVSLPPPHALLVADRRGRQRMFQSLDNSNNIAAVAASPPPLHRSSTSKEPLRQIASSDASLSANDLTQLMPPSLTIITSSRGLPFPMERSASVGHAEVGSLDSWAEDDSLCGDTDETPSSVSSVSPRVQKSSSSAVLMTRAYLLPSFCLAGELVAQTAFFESDEGQWYHGKWESITADAERGFNRVSDPVLLHIYKSISESSRFQLKALEKAWDDLRVLSRQPIVEPHVVRFVGGQLKPLVAECYEAVDDKLTPEWFQAQPSDMQLSVCVQICRAIDALHRVHFVHRALHTGSFFLAGNRVKVLCCSPNSSARKKRLPMQAVISVPPEVMAGDPWTAASDIYTLGFVLVDIIADVCWQELTPLIVRCCAADPAARPTASDVVHFIEAIANAK